MSTSVRIVTSVTGVLRPSRQLRLGSVTFVRGAGEVIRKHLLNLSMRPDKENVLNYLWAVMWAAASDAARRTASNCEGGNA